MVGSGSGFRFRAIADSEVRILYVPGWRATAKNQPLQLDLALCYTPKRTTVSSL